jgi:hypothetical protein
LTHNSESESKMLNLSSGGGSGSYIRFSPQANAWTNQDGEIQLGKVVFDIDNVTTGWLELGVGVRDWQPDAALGKKGPQPTANHKRGFSIVFYSKALGTVEWSSNGVGPNMGLEHLYKQCSEQRAANPDKLPVIEYTGSRMEKIGKGTTRIPNFTLTGWIARPAGMDAQTPPIDEFDPFPAPVPAPAAPAAKQHAAPIPVHSDEDLF